MVCTWCRMAMMLVIIHQSRQTRWQVYGPVCVDFVTILSLEILSQLRKHHKHSEIRSFSGKGTLPETNSKFAPENGCLVQMIRLPFRANGLFSEACAVSFRGG